MKVKCIEKWKTKEPTNIQELVDKYRPKEVKKYVENGVTVRVFEMIEADL